MLGSAANFRYRIAFGSVSAGILILFFQNCEKGFSALDPSLTNLSSATVTNTEQSLPATETLSSGPSNCLSGAPIPAMSIAQAAYWLMDGTSATGVNGALGADPGPAWNFITAADFGHNGHSDLIWQNLSGQAIYWRMNGCQSTTSGNLGSNPGPEWRLVSAVDLDGNGSPDLIWQNLNGQVKYWLMNGVSPTGVSENLGPNPGPAWKLIAAADIDGDGNADLIWQNSNGQAFYWLLHRLSVTGSSGNLGVNPGTSWRLAGAVDMNRDGKPDLIWQNTDGQAVYWLMQGTIPTGKSGNLGASPGTLWRLVGATDLSQDGNPDLMFQKKSPVSPGMFKLSADVDDTNSIAAALTSCRDVEFASSKVYTISRPIPICSGGHQEIFGHGNSSVVKLASTYDINQVAPCSAASDGAQWRPIFFNPNCGGPVGNSNTYIDTHISYHDFKIDGSATNPLGATIALFNRNTRFVHIYGMTCDQFADCTATLASSDTLIEDSVATNIGNAGFDFWDSPKNATVLRTTVTCNSVVNNYGLLFNSSDTTSTHGGVGENYTATNNTQIGCNVSIFIDPLTADGVIKNINITGNKTKVLPSAAGKTGWMAFTGNIVDGEIRSAQFCNFHDNPANAIFIGPSAISTEIGVTPTNVSVTSPSFSAVCL